MTTEQQILQFAQARWGRVSLGVIAAKLAEETGEVCGAIFKMPEGRATQADFEAELGDVLIVLSQFAARCGKTLEQLREARWRKIRRRPVR